MPSDADGATPNPWTQKEVPKVVPRQQQSEGEFHKWRNVPIATAAKVAFWEVWNLAQDCLVWQAGTSWHPFRKVSQVVLCDRPNTFARFSEDDLHLFRGRRYFGGVHVHFLWQAQHFRRVVSHLVQIRRVRNVTFAGRARYWDTLHFTLYTLHFTLYTSHLTCCTPHSTPYALHSTLYTVYTLHLTLHTLHFTLHSLHFPLTFHTLHFATRHFTLHNPHFIYTHCIPHPTLHCFHTPRSAPHPIPRSTV